MDANLRGPAVRWAAVAFCLTAALSTGDAAAGLSGSRHDFTSLNNPNPAIVAMGSCSACHRAHRAQPGTVLWTRSLSQELARYSLDANPNYTPGATLLCYDCHDDATSADADPDPAGWSGGAGGSHRPQDIALGTDATGPVGYYELSDGTFPTAANAPKSTSPTLSTGGHYWKTDPSGTPDYRRGDKIACELCHDPHDVGTGTNDAFFRTATADGNGSTISLGNGLKSSPLSRNHQSGGTGREMCAACHKYSDTAGAAATLWGVALPKPPATRAEHLAASAAPCTDCHRHNRIAAGCNECHTFPGLPNLGGLTHRLTPVHDAHVGVPSNEAAVPNKGYQCSACHLGAAHNSGTGGAITGPAQWVTLVTPNLNNRVQVRFDPSLNPGTTNPADTTLDSSSYDDVNNVCSNLACHGADAANFGPASGTDTTPDWDLAATGSCGTCHDTGTDDVSSPGTSIGTGNHATHLTAARGPLLGTVTGVACVACHPAYERSPGGMHANGTTTFLNANNSTVTTLASTDVCANCHGASVASAKTPANWANGSFLLECLECHDATNPANSRRDGTGLNAPAKSVSWATRGHGNTTTYPWGADRAGAGLTCVDCHAAASGHIDGSLGTTDRLTTAGNALCNGCHDGAGPGPALTQVSTHANTSGTMGAAPVSYTAQRALFELNCVECHDVHGTANIFMINTGNPDGPLVAPRTYNGIADFTRLLFQGAAVSFTDNGVGTDYAVAVANADKICQTCHTTTGGAGTPVYQHNNPTTGHDASKCTGCHAHDVDNNSAANSQDGFMPRGDCKSCHDAASPYDPDGAGPKPAAPGIDMAVWAASGHGKATGPTVGCTDCHDISLPASPMTHLDNVYNSVWENGAIVTRNANTAHLRSEFFTPYTGVPPAGNAWDIQVTFDNRCSIQCHSGRLVKDMRHTGSLDQPTDHWYGTVQMGTKASYFDGDRSGTPGNDALNAPYPIDCDLNTGANCADVDFAPCVTCHDPHGTSIADPQSGGANVMLRRMWLTLDPNDSSLYLCKGCHP